MYLVADSSGKTKIAEHGLTISSYEYICLQILSGFASFSA
jgi:hypothetical protein